MQTAIIITLVIGCSIAASLLMGRFINAGGNWDEEPATETEEGA